MSSPVRFIRFWSKRPMFVIALAMAIVFAVEFHFPLLGWLLAAVFSVALFRSLNFRAAVALFVLNAIMLGNAAWREAEQHRGEKWISEQKPQQVEARLLEDAKGEKGRWVSVAKIRREGLSDVKVRWLGSGEPLPAGTELKCHGVFKPLEPQRNPGLPDRIAMLRAEGIVGSFRASAMRQESWIGPFSEQKARFKKSFHESIIAGLDAESTAAKVIRAVVIGERSPDSLGLIRAFLESGTLHVFTVSGLHVTMVGGILWFVLGWLNCPRRAVIPVIIVAMFVYVWLTGNGPAALRAAWMSSVFLGAFMLRRRPDLLNALGTVLLIAMLLNPNILRFPGVQLSYGVVAAIGLGTAMARRCFDWIAEEEELLPKSELTWLQDKWLKFRQDLAKSLAVSLAASVGSTPLTIFHFGLVTPVSIFATVFLVIQVFILLFVALFSAMIHPLWPTGSEFLNRNNAIVANACAWTAGNFAKIPGAWVSTKTPTQDTLILYDLDYGADAACFASADGNAVLIDNGGKFGLENTVGKSLSQLGITPDSILITHADSGHVAPLSLTREMFPIRQVVMGAKPTRSTSIREWLKDSSINIVQPHRGSTFPFGNGVHAEILLSPHDHLLGSVADDRCMVFMLHWRGWKILWLGDAGRLSEQALLASSIDLRADLIVAGMHSSDSSLTPAFLEAVSPQAIILPRLTGSIMDEARSLQTQAWKSAPFQIIDRQQTGGVTITINEGRLVIRGYLDSKAIELRHKTAGHPSTSSGF